MLKATVVLVLAVAQHHYAAGKMYTAVFKSLIDIEKFIICIFQHSSEVSVVLHLCLAQSTPLALALAHKWQVRLQGPSMS